MAKGILDDQSWQDTLERLKNSQIPQEQIPHAIVKLGKPFDKARIDAAKDTVALYLRHANSLVRHEAMWFLSSWGRLKEYQPDLIRALRSDPDPDNRSFAATCLGRLQEKTGDLDAVAALKAAVEDENLDQVVRLHAYGALRQVVQGISDLGYFPQERTLSEIDWEWVHSLSQSTI